MEVEVKNAGPVTSGMPAGAMPVLKYRRPDLKVALPVEDIKPASPTRDTERDEKPEADLELNVTPAAASAGMRRAGSTSWKLFLGKRVWWLLVVTTISVVLAAKAEMLIKAWQVTSAMLAH